MFWACQCSAETRCCKEGVVGHLASFFDLGAIWGNRSGTYGCFQAANAGFRMSGTSILPLATQVLASNPNTSYKDKTKSWAHQCQKGTPHSRDAIGTKLNFHRKKTSKRNYWTSLPTCSEVVKFLSLHCSALSVLAKYSGQESEVSSKWSNDLIPVQEGQVFSSRTPEYVLAKNQETNPSAP